MDNTPYPAHCGIWIDCYQQPYSYPDDVYVDDEILCRAAETRCRMGVVGRGADPPYWGEMVARHMGNINVAFLDGHVMPLPLAACMNVSTPPPPPPHPMVWSMSKYGAYYLNYCHGSSWGTWSGAGQGTP